MNKDIAVLSVYKSPIWFTPTKKSGCEIRNRFFVGVYAPLSILGLVLVYAASNECYDISKQKMVYSFAEYLLSFVLVVGYFVARSWFIATPSSYISAMASAKP